MIYENYHEKLCNINLVTKGPQKSVLESGHCFFENLLTQNKFEASFLFTKIRQFFIFNQILNAIKLGIIKFLFCLIITILLPIYHNNVWYPASTSLEVCFTWYKSLSMLEWVNEWWHVRDFVCNFCNYSPYYCSR